MVLAGTTGVPPPTRDDTSHFAAIAGRLRHTVAWTPGAGSRRPQRMDQALEIDRLHEVLLEPGLLGPTVVGDVAVACDRDHAQVVVVASQARAQLVAIHQRQPDVEQRER